MPVVESTRTFAVEALQPAAPLLDVPDRGDDSGIAQIALNSNEIEIAKQLDAESFIRLYKPLPFFELNLAASQVDTFYQESQDPVYNDFVLIPIYIRPNPPRNLLKRFGIEEECEGIGLFSLGWLQKNLDLLRIKTGDRIGYYDQPYTESSILPHNLPNKTVIREVVAHVPNFSWELLDIYYTDYWGNSQIPIHLVASLKNLRAPGRPDTNVNPR